ncbi:MAG: hypothetical protein CMI60_04050 [Parvibaculum sp.]|nr:hypothetical protein [Parvibaculum sp.]
MAKVDRDPLPRGAELLKEHIFEPVTAMAAALSGNVAAEQTQCTNGSFRLNLSIPYISAKFFWANPGGWYYIPFCLPPLQEDFQAAVTASGEFPFPELNEVGFSFDQRSEPALPADRYAGKAFDATLTSPDANYVSNIYEGNAVYERAGSVDIKLAIFEKSQHYFSPQVIGSGTDATAVQAPGADAEVFSTTLSAAEISANAGRSNPVCYSGLSVTIDPKKTYMFAINADELVDPVSTTLLHTALVSVNVSLKFKMPLVERDAASAGAATDVQNVPTASYGARASETISIASPSAGGVVVADAAAGVSTELAKIDSRLRHGIYGGYAEFSAANVAQQMKDDAGYEVIAVPLFNNTAFGEVLARPTWMRMRDNYDAANPAANGYHDRAIIPITAPMTIHHVMVTNNYLTATQLVGGDYTMPPDTGKIRYQVGVGIVAGPGSDDANYTQVAYNEIQADTAAAAGLIDFMDMGNTASSMKGTTFRPQRWEQAIFSVPLVRGGATGVGYSTQGKPFFVGEGASSGLDTAPRTQVGNPASAGANIAPPSAGMEQLIEVRMAIRPQGAVFNAAGSWQGYVTNWTNFSGYGGSWVYIIGKKHMRT